MGCPETRVGTLVRIKWRLMRLRLSLGITSCRATHGKHVPVHELCLDLSSGHDCHLLLRLAGASKVGQGRGQGWDWD